MYLRRRISMLRYLFRRLPLAASLVVLLSVAFSSVAPLASAKSQAATGTLSLYNTYTADGNNNPKSVFQDGNTIHYLVGVKNSSGGTITATIQLWAYWGKAFADTSPMAAILGQM